MSAKTKSPAKPLNDQEIQQKAQQLLNEQRALASKIGELESEADEHELVLVTLNEALQKDPSRICFRLVGGVLVERTVKDVVPALRTNLEGIRKVVSGLADQYKTKEEDFETFKREYNIRPVTRA
ncbi:Prefoldin beta-like protein [Schizopora paradoxa]|uniref:Prefoldin beta-like protein n=1 Tax=Schizopora paradoxa TaxID=27342 RepID=A0A0H2SFU0_9AGAM|nr:Prefoldin beta-like protein [Schizopora paradoxa]